MSDKPTPTRGGFFAIPDIAVLSLEGRDAVAFAQSQFMSDVSRLAPGHWQWSGWLTPKGRIVSLFALARLDDSRLLLLVLSANDPQALATRLKGFVFRSKVSIDVRDDLHVTGAFTAPQSASGAQLSGTLETGIEFDVGGQGQPRTLRVVSEASVEPDPAALSRWHAQDLAHGLPRLPADQLEQWTPQQLSLERLNAFSVHKGCYPGQEIVARTHFLGQAKRALMRLQGDSVGELDEVMAGAPPTADGEASVRPVGQIICASGNEGLAVMPVDAGDGPFHANGAALQRLPLLDGLAR